MSDRELLRANPRYAEVAQLLQGDPLYTKIWQLARERASCVEERYLLNEMPFAFEPRYVTYYRNPDRDWDYPGEEAIKYGRQLLLVCKFPSQLVGENEVVQMFTDDRMLNLSDDELLRLVEIATDGSEEICYI